MINTGGQAFPIATGIYTSEGMTLRDYFAAASLPAIIKESSAKPRAEWVDCIDAAVTLSYLIADAMIKAR